MRCPTVDSLFLRTNGDFACWDDAGSDRVLLPWDSGADMAAVYSREGPAAAAAERLAAQRLPDPAVCTGCSCLRPEGRPIFLPGTVDMLQVEPSVLCDLRCPACATQRQRLARKPPRVMPPDVLEKTLGDFEGADIGVRTIDFSGHGEPLRNPELPRLLSTARRIYPGSFTILRTNANGEPDPALFESGLGQIHMSIDGVDAESYAEYRIGGDFDVAWTFLQKVCRMVRVHGYGTRTVWNYILFGHNSGTSQLRRAWRMAQGSGVDELRFVLTRTGRWSRTVTTGKGLVAALRKAGVPRGRIRVDTGRGLEARTVWKDLLKRSDMAYRAARGLWRTATGRTTGSGPIVTADYCGVSQRRLQGFLRIGLTHLAAGRREAAAEILEHVRAAVRRPGRHNPRYDPGESLAALDPQRSELAGGLSSPPAE